MARDLKSKLKCAARQNLSREEVLSILEERTQAAQHELAVQLDAGDDVLGYLAQHGGASTRRAVAANIACPPHANRLLSDDDDDEVRGELARKIARLMPDLSRAEMLHLREISIELLEKLAHDQAPRVRAILAEEIKRLDCVPKSVVVRLARDLEEIVAAPILEYSPLLSDADLIEIIAGAQAEFALGIVARRRPLSAAVSDAIVGSLDIPAVAALLANPHADIRAETLQDLMDSAENIAALHAPLTLRSDLSARTIRRLASFVGTALLSNLAERGDINDSTRAFLNRRLRMRLEKEGDPDAAPRELPEISVNEDAIERAVEAGNKASVVASLAALAKVPPETVRRILDSRSAKAVIALVWKAQLSPRLAFKIQNFVMRLTARESLPPRGGTHFPLNEEEMRWQLNYFDVPTP